MRERRRERVREAKICGCGKGWREGRREEKNKEGEEEVRVWRGRLKSKEGEKEGRRKMR